MLVKASAPGSMMLLGEYAVLQGKQALVCAVDRRITVRLLPREDKKIKINSILGDYESEIATLKISAPFEFILTTLKKFTELMSLGCELTISSDFSHKIGLGSSAAVTVATLAALKTWLDQAVDSQELLSEARAIIREVQGLGSGADVAASVYGGMVAYKMQPMQAEKISQVHPITAVYSGYKTPTVKAVQQVEKFFSPQPHLYQEICEAIDNCAVQGIRAARAENWQGLGDTMNAQQILMHSLGVNTPDLNAIVLALRRHKNILGAKISGSGLGDCIIALGNAGDLNWGNNAIETLPVSMSLQGVVYEKN
jgi:mevalonate kinase